MKITVVTAVYNSASTVGDTLRSVQSQDYSDIEHIVVDGMSTDDTPRVISENSSWNTRVLRESDNGIYDALNKGIEASTGDLIGFLHADDVFAETNAVSSIVQEFRDHCVDAVYGDLCYVKKNSIDQIVRYWKSGAFRWQRFLYGWMPPHPTFYARRQIYERFGGYRVDLGSAADYECLVRMIVKHRINVSYIPKVLVNMRLGGESNVSWINRLIANKSDRQAWYENDLRPPIGLRILKPASKIKQYFMRP